jgi:pheromone shutdown protein TraB
VHRRKRLDVVESQDVLVLEHFLARKLAAKDARKDIVVVIGASGIDRHRRRSVSLCLEALIGRDLSNASSLTAVLSALPVD